MLLDHREVGLFADELIVVLLMAGSHDEARRVRTHFLVLPAPEQNDLRATLVLALAEEGRGLVAQLELFRLLFKTLVDVAEGDFVLRGLRCRAVHGTGLSAAAAGETPSLIVP